MRLCLTAVASLFVLSVLPATAQQADTAPDPGPGATDSIEQDNAANSAQIEELRRRCAKSDPKLPARHRR